MSDTTRFDWAMSRAIKLYPSMAWQLEYRHDGVALLISGSDWTGVALAGVSGAGNPNCTQVVDTNMRDDKKAWLDKMLEAAARRAKSPRARTPTQR